ncbi:putative membrane protein [Herbihabitans rhizosphaerae]|uniref:Putative membrane protein n=1 Tax=Herbihabitans rhizosphaerae TaxID=1872711 RepID=A0A4V2ES64_9PSEU|nr:multidrug DMT transporter permease [Herbihabitans rhizosphaerae]RZS36483.1 putative membrane protein [Herbihabitans rhizosphaerae]
MTGTLLALGSAATYGVADLAGGLLSRRVGFAAVALLGQVGGLVLSVGVALAVPSTVTLVDLGWGALSGVGTGAGMAFLYRGLSRGAMSVVVPVSAVGGVALPVLVGVILLGDRPSGLAWVGIVVAVPALWLVSWTGSSARADVVSGVPDALLASMGIAVQYLALAQAGPDAGIWPVVAGRVAAVLALAPVVARRARESISAAHVGLAAAIGGMAALALSLYLLATRQQMVVVAVVLSSLYPVIPVVFGMTALRERLCRTQVAGLLGAGAATVLLSL